MFLLRIASTLLLAAVTAAPVATVREALLEKSPQRAVVFVSFDAEPVFDFSVRRETRTVVLDFGKAKLRGLEQKLGAHPQLVESARLVQVNPRDVRLTLTVRPGAHVTLYRRDGLGSSAREFALLVERPDQDANSGPVAWPVNGRLSSKFGWRIHPILGVGRMHHGVDLAVKKGTPIRPMQAGKVVFAGHRGEAGLCVIVHHGGGLSSSYGHCQKILVKEGDAVERSAVIAHSGDTGMCTGPHVHFAVTKDGKPVDPAAYLRGQR